MSDHPVFIDRYRVVERIGSGGMGVLYLARDPTIDRRVAIKVAHVQDAELRQRFLREARATGRLDHRNIVTIFDVGEHGGEPFIAMEYVPGRTLAEIVRERAPLPILPRLRMLRELCDGLAYAHAQGVVHRDVKPANLMVRDDSGALTILDFGIARLADTLTGDGVMIGTPNYMAPETDRRRRRRSPVRHLRGRLGLLRAVVVSTGVRRRHADRGDVPDCARRADPAPRAGPGSAREPPHARRAGDRQARR